MYDCRGMLLVNNKDLGGLLIISMPGVYIYEESAGGGRGRGM